jgi:hypothetical protein
MEFKCTTCELNFSTCSNLRKHERTNKHILKCQLATPVNQQEQKIKELEEKLQMAEFKLATQDKLIECYQDIIRTFKLDESKSEPKVESIPEIKKVKKIKIPKVESELVEIEIKVEPKVESKTVVVESKPEPKVESKTVVVESKPEPKIESKIVVVESKPEPKVELKSEPKSKKTFKKTKDTFKNFLDQEPLGCLREIYGTYFPDCEEKYKLALNEWFEEYYEERRNIIIGDSPNDPKI